ncbi:hypothetical protein WN51_00496 [Melipona quadrifasciata]|uniref:Uncharacterized protein n=1 Tax=Melipona quadrifasciata TaxID=166423 RepID=A0A0M9A0Q9_9HYME|nr:hypothetical protein WN51_00496 [Melipona quadrifasciata]
MLLHNRGKFLRLTIWIQRPKFDSSLISERKEGITLYTKRNEVKEKVRGEHTRWLLQFIHNWYTFFWIFGVTRNNSVGAEEVSVTVVYLGFIAQVESSSFLEFSYLNHNNFAEEVFLGWNLFYEESLHRLEVSSTHVSSYITQRLMGSRYNEVNQ